MGRSSCLLPLLPRSDQAARQSTEGEEAANLTAKFTLSDGLKLRSRRRSNISTTVLGAGGSSSVMRRKPSHRSASSAPCDLFIWRFVTDNCHFMDTDSDIDNVNRNDEERWQVSRPAFSIGNSLNPRPEPR